MAKNLMKQVRYELQLARNRIRNPAVRFNEDTQLQLLLSRGVDDINIYLFEVFIQAAERFPILKHVREDQLYLVHSPSFEPEGFLCLLGEDITSPSFCLDTVDQLKESFEWHRRYPTFDSRYCQNLDVWVEWNLRMCLYQLEQYKTILSLQLLRWRDVFFEERKPLQLRLINHQISLRNNLRKEMAFLARKKAPVFMIKALGGRYKKIIETVLRLQQPMPY